jgi:hypothetical protein
MSSLDTHLKTAAAMARAADNGISHGDESDHVFDQAVHIMELLVSVITETKVKVTKDVLCHPPVDERLKKAMRTGKRKHVEELKKKNGDLKRLRVFCAKANAAINQLKEICDGLQEVSYQPANEPYLPAMVDSIVSVNDSDSDEEA